MRITENTQYHVEDTLDVRYFNVLKLNTPRQCEIILAEINFCIENIKQDLISGRDDPAWNNAARKAVTEYEHKARMAELRRQELLEIIKESKSEKKDKQALFFEVARGVLDTSTFEKIKMIAKSKEKKNG